MIRPLLLARLLIGVSTALPAAEVTSRKALDPAKPADVTCRKITVSTGLSVSTAAHYGFEVK
jgi:hypothetical protein